MKLKHLAPTVKRNAKLGSSEEKEFTAACSWLALLQTLPSSRIMVVESGGSIVPLPKNASDEERTSSRPRSAHAIEELLLGGSGSPAVASLVVSTSTLKRVIREMDLDVEIRKKVRTATLRYTHFNFLAVVSGASKPFQTPCFTLQTTQFFNFCSYSRTQSNSCKSFNCPVQTCTWVWVPLRTLFLTGGDTPAT
jgi:hypothetical protein